MTRSQKAMLQLSEAQTRLRVHLDLPTAERSETWTADLDTLKTEVRSAESEFQGALLVEPEPTEVRTEEDSEGRELNELRNAVSFETYMKAAMAGHGVFQGAEAEFNSELGIAEDHFPLEILTRDDTDDLETRAAVDGDAGRNQASWIERLFAGTAAQALGVTMPSVGAGISAYPVLGSNANPAQRGRTQVAVDATITAAVTEVKPSRSAVRAVYSIEDNARLPGFAAAIGRDLSSAMTEKIDRTIFVGDASANENVADVTGFTTAGISEVTLTQANKVKADELLKLLAGLVDGKYASSMNDVRVVATVGSNQLWLGTVQNSAASNDTLAKFLRENGVSWTTRGEIETATANGDFGAFIGLNRGIRNAAVAPVWSGAQLVRDPYSGAAKGEVALTLNYLWNFAIPRAANFRRLKYVT